MNNRILKPNKKEISILMIAGCLLGILCFAFVYGFKIVNFTYNGWLFNGDMDLRQHYVGFCHFRVNPWHFPIGIVDTLSVPYSMSVVYTDSIPLFALIFKLFRNVLPETFQYFGLFGLICFALMGALSPVLIRRFSDSKIVCLAGSLFFILSFPILHRMFYHTALSAQWIIVLALIAWLYSDITDKTQLKRLCISWALIGVLSVLIHSYFVFMTGIVLLAQIVDGYTKTCLVSDDFLGKKNNRVKLLFAIIGKNLYMLLPLLCMGVASFVMLYILGGFYGSGSVSGDGFGSFYANLSSYINPLHFSSIFNGFDNNGMFEFEGFAYLGAGIFVILITAAIYKIVLRLKGSNDNSTNDFGAETYADQFANLGKETVAVIWIFVAIVLLFSCFPSYSFGKIQIIKLPLPGFVKSLLGICRTNARFVWVGMYLIFIMALSFIGKNFDKVWVKLLFALAIIIQLYDMSAVVKEYHAKYARTQEFDTIWYSPELEGITDGKEEIVFMYDHNDIMMDTAYYAYLNGMSQNSFYFARTIYDEIDATIAEWSEEFLNGKLDDKVVYVFRYEDYTKEYDDVVSELGAKKIEMPEHVIVVK